MIPIAIVQYKYEARRLEKQLIRRYDPKINMEESERRKKYTDMTYKRKEQMENKHRCSDGRKDVKIVAKRENILSTYWYEETNKSNDCGAILRSTTNEFQAKGKVTISYILGSYELTRWATVKKNYGDYIVTKDNDIEVEHITFTKYITKLLNEHEGRTQGSFTITPPMNTHQKEKPRIYNFSNPSQDIRKQLCTMNNHDLDQMWFDIKNIKNDTGLKRSMKHLVWSEYETRYKHLTRNPIQIKLPYCEFINVYELKTRLKQIIQAQKWPRHVITWHQQKLTVVTAKVKNIRDTLVNVNK